MRTIWIWYGKMGMCSSLTKFSFSLHKTHRLNQTNAYQSEMANVTRTWTSYKHKQTPITNKHINSNACKWYGNWQKTALLNLVNSLVWKSFRWFRFKKNFVDFDLRKFFLRWSFHHKKTGILANVFKLIRIWSVLELIR